MPVACVCQYCNTTFVVPPSAFHYGRGKYCSSSCYHQARGPGPVQQACLQCQTTFTVKASRVRDGDGRFCSRACVHTYQMQDALQIARFWENVLRTEACWLWQGNRYPTGYGQFSVGAKKILAHRYAFELHYGLLLPSFMVLHHCDTKLCVRWEHLFPGMQADNMVDMIRKGRHDSKLTEGQVREIRQLYVKGSLGYIRLARAFGVSQPTIAKIIKGKIWKHID